VGTVIQCPNCSKPVVIPDQVDVGPLQRQVAQLEARLGAKVDGVAQSMGSHPKPSVELFDLWSNCPECKGLWDKVRAELKEKAIKSVHVKPSLAVIREFENCPECREAWEKMKRDSPQLFKPTEPAPAGTKWWWDKEVK
jgi:ssDNA-binding Zn-finger/Zn-ribbon topoisomerase 1